MHNMKHFLSLADLSTEEIGHLLDLARALKAEWQKGGNRPILQGKTLGMIFQKPSLRTRVSFDVAMLHLGGHALYLSPNEIQIGQRESIADVARVLSRYVDAIMARVFAHRDVEELARHASVPVINGLSDYSHPCQGLADLLTILEHKGSLQGLKLAYLGDGNNVAASLAFGAASTGLNMVIASPAGYELPVEVVERAQTLGRQFSAAHQDRPAAQLMLTRDPYAAVHDADIIYTDVWTSMGQEAERERRLRDFPLYQVNAALVAAAKPDVIVMHCLPAHRGEEITDEVIDGPRSAVFDQAENRMHAQKAILVWLLVDARRL